MRPLSAIGSVEEAMVDYAAEPRLSDRPEPLKFLIMGAAFFSSKRICISEAIFVGVGSRPYLQQCKVTTHALVTQFIIIATTCSGRVI